MYGFTPKYSDECNNATSAREITWDGDVSLIPISPPYCPRQHGEAKSLYEQVYPQVRPRPERDEFDDYLDFLVDEADELKDVFEAGDENALFRALRILRGSNRDCAWASKELDGRHDDVYVSKDIEAFFRRGSRSRAAPKSSAVDRRWTAHVRIAFLVARQAGYNKTASYEVAGRILEKIKPAHLPSRKYSCNSGAIERQLSKSTEDVLQLLTNQHASELTFSCCSWFVYIAHEESHTLPPKR